jgi:hypothetical protein
VLILPWNQVVEKRNLAAAGAEDAEKKRREKKKVEDAGIRGLEEGDDQVDRLG